MNIIQLPEEILILIVKKLDLHSQHNLGETCTYLSRIVTLIGVVKECTVSPGRLASTGLLKLEFFKSIAGHLKVLNLSAIHNLTRSALLPAVKLLKCLETLDVSYTKIIIPDLVDIKISCALLKNISINFLFGKYKMGVRIDRKVLMQCQDVFQYFENVEFVGVKGNLMQSQLPLYLLKKAYLLNIVKLTVIKSDHIVYQSEEYNSLFKFNQLQLLFLPWNQIPPYSGHAELYSIILDMFDMTKIEYLIMLFDNEILQVQKLYSSPVFNNFLDEHFGEPYCTINSLGSVDISKNVIFLIWNKETTTFDEIFFSKLWGKMKGLIPSVIQTSEISQPAPKNIDWHYIFVEYSDVPHRHVKVSAEEPQAKKQRTGLINHILDFDEYFNETNNLKLTLQFVLSPTVCLNPTNYYLRKLTYLSLMGTVQFSKDFFKVLFECCEKLETLNIEPILFPCAKLIANSISLSSSLKNFRLAKKIEDNNINILLKSISNCKLIENIHIFNKRLGSTELADLSFVVAKCTNLHSLYVRNVMSDNNRLKILRWLNNAKNKYGKPYLNLELYNVPENNFYLGDSYNPFIDVFKLNPLKRI